MLHVSCCTFALLLIPPLVLSYTHAHLCDTSFCNISCDIVRYPRKASTKYFGDTIAESQEWKI